VAGILLPASGQQDFVTGYLDLHEEQINVLDLEKAIAASASAEKEFIPAVEALS
jgi:hypothetical protein